MRLVLAGLTRESARPLHSGPPRPFGLPSRGLSPSSGSPTQWSQATRHDEGAASQCTSAAKLTLWRHTCCRPFGLSKPHDQPVLVRVELQSHIGQGRARGGDSRATFAADHDQYESVALYTDNLPAARPPWRHGPHTRRSRLCQLALELGGSGAL